MAVAAAVIIALALGGLSLLFLEEAPKDQTTKGPNNNGPALKPKADRKKPQPKPVELLPEVKDKNSKKADDKSTKALPKATKDGREFIVQLDYEPAQPGLVAPALAILRPEKAALFGKADGSKVVFSLPKDFTGTHEFALAMALGRRRVGEGKDRKNIDYRRKGGSHPFFAWPKVDGVAKPPRFDFSKPWPKPLTLKMLVTTEVTRVAVYVQDEAGEPVPKLEVSYNPQPYAMFFRSLGNEQLAKGITNDKGECTLTIPKCKTLTIRAWKTQAKAEDGRRRGFLRASQNFDWPPPSKVTLTMKAPVRRQDDPRNFHVFFEVQDAEGNEVKDARISLKLHKAAAEQDEEQWTQEWARNDYNSMEIHFRGKRGLYKGKITADKGVKEFELELLNPGQRTEKSLVLDKRSEVYGRILLPNGQPAPDVRVQLSAFGPLGQFPKRSRNIKTTDAKGEFRLAIGDHHKWLQAYKDGYEHVSVSIEALTMPAEIRLKNGQDVFGQLFDSQQQPAKGARVRLVFGQPVGAPAKGQEKDDKGFAKNSFRSIYGSVDEQGRYRFKGMPANKYSLVVRQKGNAPSVRILNIERNKDQSFQLPDGQSWSCTLKAEGKDLSHIRGSAQLVCIRTSRAGLPANMEWEAGRGASGRARVSGPQVSFEGLAPGDYLLEVQAKHDEQGLQFSNLERVTIPSAHGQIELGKAGRVIISAPASAKFPKGEKIRFEYMPEAALEIDGQRQASRGLWLKSWTSWTIQAGAKDREFPGVPPGRYRLTWRLDSDKSGMQHSLEFVVMPEQDQLLTLR